MQLSEEIGTDDIHLYSIGFYHLLLGLYNNFDLSKCAKPMTA